MKVLLFLLVHLRGKSVKTVYNEEIICALNELLIPQNSNGWICGPAENDLDVIAWCNVDCMDNFQVKKGFY